jgi:diketogulonate reductase-like aldo/keto reductase
VGEAVRESGIPRSDLFITTKFWPNFAAPDHVELALDQCLAGMGLEYVDLFLAHWPLAWKAVSRDALEAASRTKLATKSERGVVVDPETGVPLMDWEHTAANIARQAGELLT